MDSNPCASATALITYLIILDIEIPRDPSEQEEVLSQISIQKIIDFQEVLQTEIIEIQDKCKTQDLDIIFILDSSGSITEVNLSVIFFRKFHWIKKKFTPFFAGSKLTYKMWPPKLLFCTAIFISLESLGM